MNRHFRFSVEYLYNWFICVTITKGLLSFCKGFFILYLFSVLVCKTVTHCVNTVCDSPRAKKKTSKIKLFSWKGPTPWLSSKHQYWVNTITCKFLCIVSLTLYSVWFACDYFSMLPLLRKNVLHVNRVDFHLCCAHKFIDKYSELSFSSCTYACLGISHAFK